MFRFILLGVTVILISWPAPAVEAGSTVLAYSATWRDPSMPPQDEDFAGITHIARAFLRPAGDGSLEVPDGYFNAPFEAAARRHGIKLLLSVGGGASGADNWIALATNAPARQRFLDRLAQLMSEYHYDGVDIDWEPMPDTPAQAQAYTSLLHALRQRFPHAILTTALDDWAKQFSWPDVVASVDYINLMTYDYAGSWTGKANLATNLHPPADYAPVAGHSVEEGLRKVIEADRVPPAKLLVGMNFWAYRFRADRLGDPFPKNDETASDALSYQQVLDLLQTGHYQALWDAHAAAPYLLRSGGGSVVEYDDPESVRRKCEYARGLGCAGIMVWNIGADVCGRQEPLMDTVVQSLGGKRGLLDRAALEAQIADARQALHRDGHTPRDAALDPPTADLSLDALESLNAALQQRVGDAIDRRWQPQSSPSPPR